MATAKVQLPPKLIPVFLGEADYRGAYGGRGSAKTRSFAKMTAVNGYKWSAAGEEGIIVCGRQFMNSLAESSMAEVKAAILSEEWLADHYEIGDKFIRTRDRHIEYDFVGLTRNLDSIKSKARIKLLWVDEGEGVTEEAWIKTIPSVREEDSEIWVTWNPETERSATHKRFRLTPPSRSKIVELHWQDNPWFPAGLDRKRLDDLERRPEQYGHIWDGEFRKVYEGAYYSDMLETARKDNRIGFIGPDPLMQLRAYWDIGGTGARSDATSIWVCQFVGKEIRILNYYEAVGQQLADHAAWLRSNGYDKALCKLPHDGANHEKVVRVTYASALREAGFTVEVLPNAGGGAAMKRVEAGRRRFPIMFFNEATTQGGREALGAYHEKRDEARGIGLGPEHDWSSHAADSFGAMALDYEEPTTSGWSAPIKTRIRVV